MNQYANPERIYEPSISFYISEGRIEELELSPTPSGNLETITQDKENQN